MGILAVENLDIIMSKLIPNLTLILNPVVFITSTEYLNFGSFHFFSAPQHPQFIYGSLP